MATTPLFAFEVQLAVAGAPDKDLRDALIASSLVFAAKRDGVEAAADILAAAQADYGPLLAALYEAGYFAAEVRVRVDGTEAADIPTFSRPPAVERVRIAIDPGPQFTFGRLRIAPLPEAAALPSGFRRGAVASTAAIRDAAAAAIDAWRAAGHAKASISAQSIRAIHGENRVEVELAIEPGPVLGFGQAVIAEGSAVRSDRLAEIAAIPTGQRFSPQVLERAAERVRATGAFRSVSIAEAEVPNTDGTLDVVLSVVDEAPRRLGFGAEFEASAGLSLSGFWLHRNLFGGAEGLRLEADVSNIAGTTGGRDYRLGATLTRPATLTPDTDLSLGVVAEERNEPLFFIRRIDTSATLARTFSPAFSARAGIELQRSLIDDDLGRRRQDYVLLPLGVDWDRRADKLDPNAGTFLSADLTPFAEIGGGTAGARLSLDLRAYSGLGNRAVLAGRLQFGSVIGTSIAQTPPDMLFFSGGGGTVRGQRFQSGFVRSGGAKTGGRSFVGLSGELRLKVTDTIGAVAFYDAGLVGAASLPFDGGNFHAGAGVGLRYDTGLGPIRLDLGLPVAGKGSGPQIYVGIGQAF